LLSGGVSFGLETVQTWLPSRVPSNLDLVCNAAGGLLGALWAQSVGPRVFARIAALEHKLIAPIPHAELGLTLLGLWLLVPLSPETLLFGAGDLRHLLGLTGAVPFAAESFVMIEACITTLMQGRLFERDIYTEKFFSAADAQQVRSPLFKRV